jgi:bifunctional pyridoxal-dependent enzyme with beta-cystathionase and maltose regulon repressor activities
VARVGSIAVREFLDDLKSLCDKHDMTVVADRLFFVVEKTSGDGDHIELISIDHKGPKYYFGNTY